MAATDQLRSLFLKGFKLSKQGNYEDPTYLGFKIVLDFGTLPIGTEDGLPPSPLLKQGNYLADTGFNTLVSRNPFGQPQYDYKTNGEGGAIAFYSAPGYLAERESEFPLGGKRSDMLIQFQNNLSDLLNNYPWFLQSISGLDGLYKVARSGFPDSTTNEFNSQRTAGKILDFTTLEALNLRMSALSTLYNQATFDFDNMRELLPRNLRRFKMFIFVSEIRNFFKTSRLVGSSAALSTITNYASLLGNGNNPGSNLGTSTINQEYPAEGSNTNPASAFNSFVGNIVNNSGLTDELSLFQNQQDQTGIKPVIVFECSNCEFDFSDSSPLGATISQGSDSPVASTNKFKIHVGRVRMKSQFPNIRQDGKPLVLADSWDGARSSVQKNPRNTDDILTAGSEMLTNFISNSLNDLINEGVANLNNNISGIDQALLGNAYSFNPGEIQAQLSFNNAQNFLNSLGNVNLGVQNTVLPNPQNTGLGGPPQRVYPKPSGDVYVEVPGRDLGVPDRVYPPAAGDLFPNSPGSDLGVPDRVYPPVDGDAYSTVPGPDLGVPDRVYPEPSGDAYADVPGRDLGVPDRIYPEPNGDAYPDVPGSALGVPDRIYPSPQGDVYPDVPGRDLGVPTRVYPEVNDDVYLDVPGGDLGVPQRAYPGISDDVYRNVPGPDLGVPQRRYQEPAGKVYPDEVPDNNSNKIGDSRVYPPDAFSPEVTSIESGSIYPISQKMNVNGELRDPSNSFLQTPSPVYPPPQISSASTKQRGDIGKVYPPTSGDFTLETPINLGNAKPGNKFNVSTGEFNQTESEFS